MLYSDKIMKDYDFFHYLLKFSIKNDINPKFRDYSLVSNYLKMICDFEIFINKLLDTNIEKDMGKPRSFENILREGYQEYHIYIDSKEKINLLKKFQIIMHVHDIMVDRCMDEEENFGYGYECMKEIYIELKKIKNNFLPVLKLINEEEIKKKS